MSRKILQLVNDSSKLVLLLKRFTGFVTVLHEFGLRYSKNPRVYMHKRQLLLCTISGRISLDSPVF